MNERQMQFRVGVVMFATLIIGGLLATLNGPMPTDWLPWGRSTYQLAIQLPQAPGVGPNTPVRKNGLLIGRVASIDDLDNGVVLHVKIDGDRRLLTTHEPHVRTSVLGDAVVDFVTHPIAVPPQPLPDGATIPGIVDPNPFDSISKLGDLQDDVQQTLQALGRAGTEVGNVAQRINEAFGSETEEGRVKRLMDKTEVAMDEFGRTMRSINEILGDEAVVQNSTILPPATGQQMLNRQPILEQPQLPAGQPPATGQPPADGAQTRQRLRQAVNDLPDAMNEMRDTMRQFRVVLESADKNLKNLEGFTEPLGKNGTSIAESITEAVDGLDRLVEEFTVLSQALNSREGTLGQLIHNPQLYENVNRLIYNANQVVVQVNDLAVKLRPVVNDARVFMDKVAREPGRVVTGGLNPSVVK